MQEKTFFLQNQETKQSELKSLIIPKAGNSVNLQALLTDVKDADKKIFKIYDAENDEYITLGNEENNPCVYSVSRQLLKLNTIIIKYVSNPSLFEDQSSSDEEQNKKQRSRERNIREVIQLVQKWREYHDNPPQGKRRTLQQAAKMVGVSKKSLDDYYYQLRVGEKHDFDFNANLQEKIGVLRAFLKIKEPQRKAEGRNAKHPKKLKIIEEFSEKLRITQKNQDNKITAPNYPIISNPKIQEQTKKQQTYSFKQPSDIQSIQDPFESQNQDQLYWGDPFTPLSQEKYFDMQKNFFDQFDFRMDQAVDPYLSFTTLGNKKSNINEDILNSDSMNTL